MKNYQCADDSGFLREIEAESAEAAAKEYVDCSYTGGKKTVYWRVRVWTPPYDECGEDVLVRLDPDEPACSHDEGHAWQKSMYFGGCEENPGVFGHGGGVVIRELCPHCGLVRITDTWDQTATGDGRPVETITYDETRQDEILTWLAERVSG